MEPLLRVRAKSWGSEPLTFPSVPFTEPPPQPSISIKGIIAGLVLVLLVAVVAVVMKWRKSAGREGAGSEFSYFRPQVEVCAASLTGSTIHTDMFIQPGAVCWHFIIKLMENKRQIFTMMIFVMETDSQQSEVRRESPC